jgi:myo-inositol-1(or 4)-monophosphatase
MALTDVEVAIAAAVAGAEAAARHYGSSLVRVAKSAGDFATQADLDAENAIMSVLDTHRPDDARTGEETGTSGTTSSLRRWLIDPLCGTANFAATTPLFVVNVTLIGESGSIAAVAADPIAGEIFWTDGSAAYVRQRDEDSLLEPSAVSGLIEINCDGTRDRQFVGGQLVSDSRLRARYGPRVISSTLGVPWVAAGRRAAYISDGSFRGDLHFAAGIALCQAAGCIITDLAGDPLHVGRGLVISADPTTHEDVLSIVQPHLAAVLASD